MPTPRLCERQPQLHVQRGLPRREADGVYSLHKVWAYHVAPQGSESVEG